MNKYFLILTIIIAASAFELNAQVIRTKAMGGLSYSITDEDFSLTPFDLGGNPAWLVNDQKSSWLNISPSVKDSRGDYRRIYDPGKVSNYNVLFTGVKTLGSSGTFLGETTYEYDMRSEVYRSLKYDTYSGEAFFMNDTTTGNFRYSGPSMKFMYSFELLDNFFAGATAYYKILDGLKSNYSRSQILYRVVSGNAGVAYKLSDNIITGLTFGLIDEQEKIEAKSEDLLDVEIFNFKGETFSVRKRASTVTQKVRKEGKTAGAQFYVKPTANFEIGIAGEMSNCKEKILIPRSFTDVSYNEFEDGYASFNSYNVVLTSRYQLSEDLLFAVHSEYNKSNSWSKNSLVDLLLWQWDISGFAGGAGASYRLTEKLLLGFEYEYSIVEGDSSKYVDSRVSSFNSNNQLARIGAEYELEKNIFLRAGYNYAMLGQDILYGGTDVSYNRITLGAGIKIFESFGLDASLDYFKYSSGNDDARSRSSVWGTVTARLYNF